MTERRKRYCLRGHDLSVTRRGTPPHDRCSICADALTKRWRQEHPEKARKSLRRRYLRWYYGITEQEYEALFASQKGCCAVCGTPEDKARTSNWEGQARLAVDHEHATGKIRGLLCRYCNLALAYLKEDEQNILNLLAYLKKSAP